MNKNDILIGYENKPDILTGHYDFRFPTERNESLICEFGDWREFEASDPPPDEYRVIDGCLMKALPPKILVHFVDMDSGRCRDIFL